MATASAVPFRTGVSRRSIDALAPAVIHASSRALGWDGIVAELGSHDGWIADDLAVDGYYLAMNTAAAPLVIENREGGRFVRRMVPPGTLVIHPYGESFSFRVADSARWAGVVLPPSLMRAVCDGRLLSCAAQFGVTDPRLLAPVAAAVWQLRDGVQGGLRAGEAAAHIAAVLGDAAGALPRGRSSGGLSRATVRRVADHVESSLASPLALSELATLAGLSLWHFARAFKAETGVSPHQFVIARRLARARLLLDRTGDTIALIAAACGFADQAHLGRCFRSRYGMTPRAYRRRHAARAEAAAEA